jgi:hypothetical protein
MVLLKCHIKSNKNIIPHTSLVYGDMGFTQWSNIINNHLIPIMKSLHHCLTPTSTNSKYEQQNRLQAPGYNVPWYNKSSFP